MIKFGPWSTTLGWAAAFGALVAMLLLSASANRVANRLLAALLLVASLRLMPYVLGFAGFYDAYPWLSFAPFDLGLATGPLLFLCVNRLVSPRLPRRWGWHFAPAAVALGYTLWAFSLPLAEKNRWNDHVHAPWIAPALSAAGIGSLAVYLAAACRFRRTYQAWLHEHVSDRDAHRQAWIGTVLLALGVWLAVTTGFDLVDRFVVDLSYHDRFPEYLMFSAIVLWLGLEGWRHAAHRYPVMTPTAPPAAPPEKDWSAQAAVWEQRLRDEGWWREPGLTMAEVASRLGTNEAYVSRAFNVGLGRNFNAIVNAMRVAAVQNSLASGEPGDLLSLALAAGFSSKASFNRVFRQQTGVSPSGWRAAHHPKSPPNTAFESTAGIAGT